MENAFQTAIKILICFQLGMLMLRIRSGESSGTLYAMFDYYNTLVEIMAGEDCEILFIPPEPMFITEDSLASIQQKILVNMLASQRQVFLQISEHLEQYVTNQRDVT